MIYFPSFPSNSIHTHLYTVCTTANCFHIQNVYNHYLVHVYIAVTHSKEKDKTEQKVYGKNGNKKISNKDISNVQIMSDSRT